MKKNQDLRRLVANPDMDLMSFPEGTETERIFEEIMNQNLSSLLNINIHIKSPTYFKQDKLKRFKLI